MRIAWNRHQFQSADRQKEESLALANDVDEGVQSAFYWAYLTVMEEIAAFERRATTFPELCPCHWAAQMGLGPNGSGDSVVPENVREDMKKQWDTCPFRGMMVCIFLGALSDRRLGPKLGVLNQEIVSFRSCVRVRGLVA